VQRAQTVWTVILGVLLILLGLTLFASPRVTYRTNEKIGHTRFSVKREKIIMVPHAIAALIVCSGLLTLFVAVRGQR